MKEKIKNKKEKSKMIKAELDELLNLNEKRKSALNKMSKSILNEKGESFGKEQKSPLNKQT